MDCCNYRAQYGWECAGLAGLAGLAGGYAPAPVAPMPYAPAPPGYYAPHAHHHYARYAYHYEGYPAAHHTVPNDHVPPMEYGTYGSKEGRVRRTQARREVRARTPSHHIPLPPTPPLECGLNGRSGGGGGGGGGGYYEPQMWPHYQSGMMGVGGWNGMGSFGGAWMSRGACAREYLRHPPEITRPIKAPQLHGHSQVCHPEGRLTPYPVYEEPSFPTEKARATPDYSSRSASTPTVADLGGDCERPGPEPRPRRPASHARLEESRPPAIVPLPAFQQAFGSTEIGRFAEAFSRTEPALDDTSSETFTFDGFSEWDAHPEPLWSSQPAAREIKCEDNV